MAGVPKWIIYARILLSISVIILFTSPGAFGEPIKIGVLLPLSGRLSELGGEMERKSYVMAAGEINGSGGIGGGRRLHFIIEDTAGKVSTGRAAAEKRSQSEFDADRPFGPSRQCDRSVLEPPLPWRFLSRPAGQRTEIE